MIIPFVKRAPTLEALREQATDGISTWLFALVDRMPGIVPERAASGADGASAAELRRFVHDAVTRNPVTRSSLPSVQMFLIELALDCADWPGLARHPRLRGLDWAGARRARP